MIQKGAKLFSYWAHSSAMIQFECKQRCRNRRGNEMDCQWKQTYKMNFVKELGPVNSALGINVNL